MEKNVLEKTADEENARENTPQDDDGTTSESGANPVFRLDGSVYSIGKQTV